MTPHRRAGPVGRLVGHSRALAVALFCATSACTAQSPDDSAATCHAPFDGVLPATTWWGSDGYSTIEVRDDGSAEMSFCTSFGEVSQAGVSAGKFSWDLSWRTGDTGVAGPGTASGTVCGDRLHLALLNGYQQSIDFSESADGYAGCD